MESPFICRVALPLEETDLHFLQERILLRNTEMERKKNHLARSLTRIVQLSLLVVALTFRFQRGAASSGSPVVLENSTKVTSKAACYDVPLTEAVSTSTPCPSLHDDSRSNVQGGAGCKVDTNTRNAKWGIWREEWGAGSGGGGLSMLLEAAFDRWFSCCVSHCVYLSTM